MNENKRYGEEIMTNYRNASIEAFKRIYGVDPTDEKVWAMPAFYFQNANVAERAKYLYGLIIETFERSEKVYDNSEENESMNSEDRKLKLHNMYGVPDYNEGDESPIGDMFLQSMLSRKAYIASASNGEEDTLKVKANALYGDEHNAYLEALTHKAGISDLKVVEMLRNLIIEVDGKYIIIKQRGELNSDIHLEDYTFKTREEMVSIDWKDPSIIGASILVASEPYKPYEPESKILHDEEVRYHMEILRKPVDIGTFKILGNEHMTSNEIDELCKVFEPIFDKQIIDSFPEVLSDTNFFSRRLDYYLDEKRVPGYITHTIRWSYIYNAGFSIITKPLADKLADYLKGKQCLEIMAGKGVLSKALQDRGIDIIATDNKSWHESFAYEDTWTEVENLEAGDAIRKYKNVDYILVSWMSTDAPSKRIVRMIRKYNPNVKLIVIGEENGGCTSNDEWFDRIEECFDIDFIEANIYTEMKSWYGIHDKIEVYKVTRPWLPKVTVHFSKEGSYETHYIHNL